MRTLGLVTVFLALVTSAWAVGWVRGPDVTGLPSGKQVKGGGGITAIGDEVYLAPGDNTLDFMKYSSGTWTALTSVPEGLKKKKVKKGAWLVTDGSGIYLFKGGGTDEFYQYDPVGNAWATLTGPGFTKGVKGGFATVVSLGGKPYIYAGSGSNTSEWKRFNISTLGWEAADPVSLPIAKVKVGSCMVTDGAGIIYFLNGNGANEFFAADLNSPTPAWVARQPLPLTATGLKGKKKVKEGGCVENLGGTFYAVKGGSTRQFWSYLPIDDAWTYLGDVASTKGIKCGKSLATGISGVYLVIGNNTSEFWYYSLTDQLGQRPSITTGAIASCASGMQLTPNPARAGTGILCSLPIARTATLEVRNSLGQVKATVTSDNGRFLIPNLAAGVYTLNVRAPSYTGPEKLVVLK
jgi:hypothetical protein